MDCYENHVGQSHMHGPLELHDNGSKVVMCRTECRRQADNNYVSKSFEKRVYCMLQVTSAEPVSTDRAVDVPTCQLNLNLYTLVSMYRVANTHDNIPSRKLLVILWQDTLGDFMCGCCIRSVP
jgi:hypothetical protein